MAATSGGGAGHSGSCASFFEVTVLLEERREEPISLAGVAVDRTGLCGRLHSLSVGDAAGTVLLRGPNEGKG
jgi:hypothetical protein